MGLAYTEAFGRSVVAAESHSKKKQIKTTTQDRNIVGLSTSV